MRTTPKKPRGYSAEVKSKAKAMLLAGVRGKQVAREFGLSHDTPTRWKREALADPIVKSEMAKRLGHGFKVMDQVMAGEADGEILTYGHKLKAAELIFRGNGLLTDNVRHSGVVAITEDERAERMAVAAQKLGVHILTNGHAK